MKFATFVDGSGRSRVGVLNDDQLCGVDDERPLVDLLGDGLESLLAVGARAIESPTAQVGFESAVLAAPIAPPQLRDSMCFHEHIRNALGGTDFDDRHHQYPAFYFSNAQGVIGPQDEVAISPGSSQFDYELEVCAVIGRGGSNIAPADAREHIIGYTMYIDWSARDLQMDEMALRLGPAKGKDGATTLGPVLVTADELEPRRSGNGFDCAMRVSINGDEVSHGNWATINWSFDDVVAYTSRGTHLVPGDVLGSGTVGKGCLLEHYRLDPEGFRGWLKPGDEVTFAVDGIGEMTQRVCAPLARHPLSSGH